MLTRCKKAQMQQFTTPVQRILMTNTENDPTLKNKSHPVNDSIFYRIFTLIRTGPLPAYAQFVNYT